MWGTVQSRRAGKSAKRRRWMQRGDFEEVPRLADTTVAVSRLARRWVREPRPYGGTRVAVRRDDVGSELSAASGRSSEVSEWPRSKFSASAVRQRRNFGHRNRVIVPYGSVTRSAVGGSSGTPTPTILSPSFRRLLPYFPLDNGQKIGII